ncbi:chorismate binding enzyme [Anaerovibrio lipolyticus DSM 3074]|uniref:Chorismate binding enzyme n=1 Tax=Anaerovibrio lipolyticus DSM 3074 TaxID=1120997 RepID=A0A1M6DY31_9FIRM|nr:chorismate binding enzyme [Anaerovibrio lipolyticus DSM 3074]
MKLTPSLEDFKEKAKKANMVALSMPISTDLDTPVSMFYKLVGEEKGFLLESVDAHQKFGRFSFIGAEPFIKMQVYKNRLMIQEEDEMRAVDGDPVTAINKYMAGLNSAIGNFELPLANGGAVGYFNYEISAVFDRVRNVQVEDEELLGQFMICRILMVFDQQKNASQLIYLASVKNGQDLDEVYGKAQQRMKELEDKLYAAVKTPKVKVAKRKEKVDFLGKYGKMPDDFAATIKKCKDYIIAGDIFQVVPSRQFREKITKPAFHFYRRLRQVNPSPICFI